MFTSAYGDDGPTSYSDGKKKPETSSGHGGPPASASLQQPTQPIPHTATQPAPAPLTQSDPFAQYSLKVGGETVAEASSKPVDAPAPRATAVPPTESDPFWKFAQKVNPEPTPASAPPSAPVSLPPPAKSLQGNPFGVYKEAIIVDPAPQTVPAANPGLPVPPSNPNTRRVRENPFHVDDPASQPTRSPDPAPGPSRQPKKAGDVFGVPNQSSSGVTTNSYQATTGERRYDGPVRLVTPTAEPPIDYGPRDTIITQNIPTANPNESKDIYLADAGIGSRMHEVNLGTYIRYADTEPVFMDKNLTYKTEAGKATRLSQAIRTIPGVPPETVITDIAIGQKHVVDASRLDQYTFKPLKENKADSIALRTSVVNSKGYTDEVCIIDAVAIKRGSEMLVGLDTRIKESVDEHDVRLYDKKRITVLNEDGAVMFATTLSLEPQPLLLPAPEYEFRDSKTDALITTKGVLKITAEHDPRPDGLRPLIMPLQADIVGGKIKWASLPIEQDAMYTLTPHFNGYIPIPFKVIKVRNKFMKDAKKSIFMSKKLTFAGELNVKLSWGMEPRDLDLHVATSAGDHVYFSNKSNSDGSIKLDIDKRDGKGPETITIKSKRGVKYRFYVHNYTGGNTTLYSSEGKVEFVANANSFQMIVPTAPHPSSERYWDCFELQDGEIKKFNRVVENPPTAGSY